MRVCYLFENVYACACLNYTIDKIKFSMCVRFEQLLRFTPILYGHVHVLLFLRGKETFSLNKNKLKIYSLFFLSDVSFHQSLSITLLFSYISPFPPLCLLFYHSCSSAAALSNPSIHHLPQKSLSCIFSFFSPSCRPLSSLLLLIHQ